ncbi:NAD(P)/FAD-dependent oxidoreductase [Legionella maioricensis]|uniref:NAD(P)/FAD-dependent oxidoreductase n=1 Tax=Legionella maioricensis TaxID=2896528 RepID=A0A9X2D1M2_9GAMM|nr:NAD(P)/FAD-dependent oxidoreductase [Legionella maioricensis]MCL9684836.1 NAD(P)/FAD-dependent oxidoreductase [Legionella maioricensis]MCL9688516.1 NAD(P)/FAD-dependent oxidoreductase [Legionella maioricensis]
MNIVVVGGGAGGLELVVSLGRAYRRQQDVKITLVDQSLTHVWKPLFHEVASGSLNNVYDKMGYLAIAKKNEFHFELGQLKKIDRQNKTILIHNPTETDKPCELTLDYDLLILAIGSVTNNFHTPGSDEFCYYLDFEWQAKKIHQVLFEKLIYNHYEKNRGPIQVAIVGGGATGVELAAELRTSLAQLSALISQKYAPKEIAIITIVEAASRILSPLPENISVVTQKQLAEMSIDILTNTRIVEVKKNGILTHENIFIPADMIIWVAGIKGQESAKKLADFEFNNAGQIKVKPTLQTTVDDTIFAFGDCACCLMPDGKQVPARAQAAHQQASLLAHSIQHILKKKALKPYRYVDYGSLVSLSHGGTHGALIVGNEKSVFITGFFARMVYLLLYKSHQVKIIGYWKVSVMTAANFLMRRVRSALKLH